MISFVYFVTNNSLIIAVSLICALVIINFNCAFVTSSNSPIVHVVWQVCLSGVKVSQTLAAKSGALAATHRSMAGKLRAMAARLRAPIAGSQKSACKKLHTFRNMGLICRFQHIHPPVAVVGQTPQSCQAPLSASRLYLLSASRVYHLFTNLLHLLSISRLSSSPLQPVSGVLIIPTQRPRHIYVICVNTLAVAIENSQATATGII